MANGKQDERSGAARDAVTDSFQVVERDGVEYRVVTIDFVRAYPTYTDIGFVGGLHLMADGPLLEGFGMTLSDLYIGRQILIRGRYGNSDAAMAGRQTLESMRLP